MPDYEPPASPGAEPLPARRRGPLVAVLGIVVFLTLGAGAGALWFRAGGDETPAASGPTGTASVSSAEPATSVGPGMAAPNSSANPRFVEVGQCVRNDGPADGTPELLITECGPQTYEVLRRVDGPTTGEKDAAAKCASVGGYTNWFFFDSDLDALDFVLCLKQR
ncbi:hypothetical protein [Salinispora sp. H7-4]|uniref:LppU/SCO3897 family protein n=1 Tax=Salinispora sp. H7-4 TaxID=2748321 RepID=UPI0015D0F636|nr:hypothetical protein [Salinispora sp. H7-4]NYT93614.1 hypothetical protein [Salinispora sp. H7-4]